MLSETATVVRLDSQSIHLKTQRKTTCSGCSIKAGCGQHLLMRDDDILFISRTEVMSGFGMELIQPYEKLQITLEPNRLMSLVVWFYVLPLGLLLMATIVAEMSGLQDAHIAISALAGLGGGLVISHVMLKNCIPIVCLARLHVLDISGSDCLPDEYSSGSTGPQSRSEQ